MRYHGGEPADCHVQIDEQWYASLYSYLAMQWRINVLDRPILTNRLMLGLRRLILSSDTRQT